MSLPMKKSTLFTLVTLLVLIPITLYLGTKLSGKAYYFISTLVIIETMLPFFFSFENRRPQARELVTLAVLTALAVVGRVAIPIPSFKAITGIIMITGVAFGPQAGFMSGAVAAFVSNFFFSQGPWTPWQMVAYGLGGFLAGVLFHNKTYKIQKNAIVYTALLAVFGFLGVVVVIGPLLDLCSVFTMSTTVTVKFTVAVLVAGFPMNVVHGASCAVTLLVLSKPLLDKLDRLKTKYGLMEADSRGV